MHRFNNRPRTIEGTERPHKSVMSLCSWRQLLRYLPQSRLGDLGGLFCLGIGELQEANVGNAASLPISLEDFEASWERGERAQSSAHEAFNFFSFDPVWGRNTTFVAEVLLGLGDLCTFMDVGRPCSAGLSGRCSRCRDQWSTNRCKFKPRTTSETLHVGSGSASGVLPKPQLCT